jgi:hypothetical protein
MNPVVYYVTCSDRPGEIKIGMSTDVMIRARNLCPVREGHENVLLAVEPGGRDVERKRHAQFAAMRKDGEWFTFGAPIISHVMELDQLPVVATAETHRMPVGA